MINHTLRYGKFTSSEIHNLLKVGRDKVSFGAPALDYIMEKRFERKLGRRLSADMDAKQLAWGRLLEGRVFELLGLEYKLVSDETIVHPEIDYFAGTPDALKGAGNKKTVVDIKCCYTLKSFMIASECLTIEDLCENHKDGEKYMWQVNSNAILTNSKFGEIIFYCPYLRELDEIKKRATDIEVTQGNTKNPYSWIYYATDDELPYLPDGCGVKNIHTIRWAVTDEVKELLTNKVLSAGILLKQETQTTINK